MTQDVMQPIAQNWLDSKELKFPKPHFVNNGKMKGCSAFVHLVTSYY